MADPIGSFSFSIDIIVNNESTEATSVELQLSKNNGATFNTIGTRAIHEVDTPATIVTFTYNEDLANASEANDYTVRWRAIGATGFINSDWSANKYVGLV